MERPKYTIGDTVMVTVKGVVTGLGIGIQSKEIMYNVSITDEEYAQVKEARVSKLVEQK